jgi:hypothetical protein
VFSWENSGVKGEILLFVWKSNLRAGGKNGKGKGRITLDMDMNCGILIHK